MDYSELIKSLRICANEKDCVGCKEATDLDESGIDKFCVTGDTKMVNEAADAIEELSKPRWIPVTERLPKERTDVLAMTADCDVYVCDFIPSVRQFWTIPGDDLHIDDITHWMPLPEPPKEET